MVFKVANNVLKGVCIFNSRFINEVKNKGIKEAFIKLRLVIQAYNNDKKRLILTQLPII
jgi:hypothetical protein